VLPTVGDRFGGCEGDGVAIYSRIELEKERSSRNKLFDVQAYRDSFDCSKYHDACGLRLAKALLP
jgi:hypothetical protein